MRTVARGFDLDIGIRVITQGGVESSTDGWKSISDRNMWLT